MINETFIVFKRTYCQHCNGMGTKRHRLWDKYWQVAKLKTIDELMSFMQNEGEPTIPSEIVNCGKCDGKGYNDKPVALSEVLATLGK